MRAAARPAPRRAHPDPAPGESLLITVVVPVVLLVFFGAVAANPPDFLVPGLLALAVMSTSMVSLGIATAYERYYGALKRLLGSPLPRGSLIAAKTLAVLLIEIVQIALLVGDRAVDVRLAARRLAARGPGRAGRWAASPSPASGLLMAGTLRAEATLAVANGLYLVFLLLGGFILPLDRLPGPIALVAHVLPAAALTDATRGRARRPQIRACWGRWRCWPPGRWWPWAPRR